MKDWEVIVNLPFQVELIQDLYGDPEDLKIAHPKAKVPFCSKEWMSFFPENTPHSSLVFKTGGSPVGHVALLDNEESLFICYVVLLKTHRGQGFGEKMIREAEEFARLNYPQHEEIFLHVNKQNQLAINLYRKLGYEICGDKNESHRMKKKLYSR